MKSKSPAFQFYPKQWLGDNNIMMMDWDVQGMHVHLMSVAWQENVQGMLANCEKTVRKLLKNIPKREWDNRIKQQLFSAWEVWEEDESRIINKGLRREYLKQKELSERNARGARTRLKRPQEGHKKSTTLSTALSYEDEEVNVLKKEKERIQKTSATPPAPQADKKCRDRVEEFLVFAQKTHEQERKALLMIRGIVDMEKIKSLFDRGIDPETLSSAWLEFLADDGKYFHPDRGRDAPPHNVAVFHGQIQAGRYLEATARRIASAKAKAKPEPPPKAREPVDPKLTGLWDKCLGKIKAQISPESYSAWFEPTYPRVLENGSLMVVVPDQFCRKMMIENYRDLIEKTLHGIRDGPLPVDFCLEADRVLRDTG